MIELVKKEPKLELTASLGAGYEKGYNKGFEEGKKVSFADGFEAGAVEGQKAEYDKFWDSYQLNGNRGQSGYQNYDSAFAGAGWNKDTFYPKYDISGLHAAYRTFESFNSGGEAFDLAQRLEECGVVLDTSKSRFANAFTYCNVTRLPVIDTRGNTNAYINDCFSQCTSLITIDKLILKDDPNIGMNNVFAYCYSLQNIVIEGIIGYNLNMRHSSKLTNASVQSIIDALYDYTGGTVHGLNLHANVKNNLTAEQWLAAGSKNWNIA
jgi:hypothetical protein